MSPPQLPDPEILPVAPLPLSLNVPAGPDVFVLTFFVRPSESLKVPVLTLELTVADPGVPAVLDLKGPCTPPPVPLEPPPPVRVNKDPAEDPDKVVDVPSLAVTLNPLPVPLPPAPPVIPPS